MDDWTKNRGWGKKLKEAEINNNCDYCFVKGTMITSAQYSGPRGKYYDLVIIQKNGNILIGEEQGNYAGGIYLWWEKPESYSNSEDEPFGNRDRLIKKLKEFKEQKPDFFALIEQVAAKFDKAKKIIEQIR